MIEMNEQLQLEVEEMEQEYEDMVGEYEGQKIKEL